MLKPIILLLASSVLALLGNLVNSTNAAENVQNVESMPIQIQSNSAEFDDKKGTATYKGDVIMQQGNRMMTSLELIIARDPQGKIDSMKATGAPAYFYVKPESDKPPVHGKANNLQYFPKQDKLLLLEEAELIQNGDTVLGNYLIYSIATRVLSSRPVPGKNTTVILTPHPKSTLTQ
jgi:lipopolysaccharide export system protein LptA